MSAPDPDNGLVQAVHAVVPGRTRYRVQGLYRSETLKKVLEYRLARVADISHVSASALTGNVLVCYNSDNTPQTIASLIEGIVTEYYHHLENGALSEESAGNPNPSSPTGTERAVLGRLTGLLWGSREQAEEPWHLLSPEEVLARFQTSPQTGLTQAQAKKNLEAYGPNVLPEAEARSGLEIFLEQFNSLPVALLGAAAGLSVLTGGLADALLIMGVVVANALIGYKTESEAEKTIQSLQTLVRPTALVIREGEMVELPSEMVTVGDLLLLRPGTTIAADARLITAHHLSVDESALTGESLPVSKSVAPLTTANIPLGDRVNLVYKGTLVTGGEGLAVVVHTGSFTEIGRIQQLASEAVSPETPLQRQLGDLGDKLVLICLGISGVALAVGSLWGQGFLPMLRTSICLAAAAVPEGLPMVATTTLALGIRSMRQHHVLIRHLNAVETLGAVQTVCLDKTGTITRNEMTVVAVFAGMRAFRVEDGEFVENGKPVPPAMPRELVRLLQVAVLCNEVEIYDDHGEERLKGTATEAALIRLALAAGMDVRELRRRYPLLQVRHRSDTRPFMATRHRHPSRGQMLAIKGSPLDVLAMCPWHLKDGKKRLLSPDDRARIEAENEHLAGGALRVLGLAYATGAEVSDEENGLTWLGIIGMADPVRPGVAEAIAAFHRAGLDTVMITGDQSPTAYAIGQELGLSRGLPLEILDATHLADLEPETLKALVRQAHVFARVSPAHKLQIVQALQQAGRVVAMTGDGINDGPALKAADVGIAMGKAGTDVAREVADVVLEKDNLDTLIVAVRDGRTIYLNIRKSVHFLLVTNLSEIMLTVSALAVGLGSPITAMQFLWINLISDVLPGLALALEAPEPDILERPPRDPQQPLFTGRDLRRMAVESGVLTAGALGAYGYGVMRYGLGPQAGTLAFHALTSGQLLHALSCRSESTSIFSPGSQPANPYLTWALAGSLVLQGLTMLVPGLRSILGLTPISLLDGLVVAAAALAPLAVNEATKRPPEPENDG